MKDSLVVVWDIGKRLYYHKEKFVRNSKEITCMEVEVIFDGEDVNGSSIRAYFISPNSETAPVMDQKIIIDGKATFKLEGENLKDFGEWQVELVFVGTNGEITGTHERVKYEVEETVEGADMDFTHADSHFSITSLIEQLNNASEFVQQEIINMFDLGFNFIYATDEDIENLFI